MEKYVAGKVLNSLPAETVVSGKRNKTYEHGNL